MELRDKIVDKLKNYVPMTFDIEVVANRILAMIQPEPAGEWGPVLDKRPAECAHDTIHEFTCPDGKTRYQVWYPAQEVTLYGEPGDIRWSIDRAIRATHTITGVIRPIAKGSA